MGIDFGEKRIGISISDELQFTAQGISVINRESLTKDLKHIKELCDKHQVTEIVMGYPLTMNGNIGTAAHQVESFKKALESEIGLPVHLWDERYSSRSAERVLLEADIGRKRRKEIKDKLAAVFILESFLGRRNR